MRACNVLDALDRITLFRAQAKQTNRRVEEIGDDLNSALSLLDLGQSRHLKAVGESDADCLPSAVLLRETSSIEKDRDKAWAYLRLCGLGASSAATRAPLAKSRGFFL